MSLKKIRKIGQHAGLDVIRMPVADLRPHPDNPRTHNERNLQGIMRSLDAFGQRTPIVVWRDRLVIKGCGTLEAAKRLEWKYIQVVLAEALPEQRAIAYMIADNQTGASSEFDWEQLSGLLKNLEEAGTDLATTGFIDYELEPLMQGTWSPPPPPADGGGGVENNKDNMITIMLTADEWAMVERAVRKRAGEIGEDPCAVGPLIAGVCELYAKKPRPVLTHRDRKE